MSRLISTSSVWLKITMSSLKRFHAPPVVSYLCMQICHVIFTFYLSFLMHTHLKSEMIIITKY